MNLIESIYLNYHGLNRDMADTKDAYNELTAYIDEKIVFEGQETKAGEDELYSSIFRYAGQKEKQGFEKGFRYAVTLLMQAIGLDE